MKNIAFVFILLCSLFCTAQEGPQNGSVAPDFTVTDINGITHSLSGYLNQGKSVIIELAGVGCGPCWKHHHTGQLADFYNAYGPSGSNEIVVLWIENSTYTTLSELQSPDSAMSFGNWIEGTPYPMILSATAYDLYSANVVPRFYRVCPDGIVTNINQPSAVACRNTINSGCGALTGVQNFARVQEPTVKNGFCGNTGNFVVQLKNYGTNNITAANLVLKENGTIVSTKQITESIQQFAATHIVFDEVQVNPSATYTAELITVNGIQNYNPQFSVTQLPFSISNPAGVELNIKIHTYSCPGNMTWLIKDSAGITVASGGPYEGYGNNPCGGTLVDDIIDHNVVLPNADECYDIILVASGGYGWKSYYGLQDMSITPGIEIYSGGNLVYSKLNVGNFGSSLILKNALNTSEALGGTDVATTDTFSIYPNPSEGHINIKTDDEISISVYDVTGKIVYHSEKTKGNTIVDLSHLENGIYVAKIMGTNNEISTQKIIISK